jgi:hypothetical protein
MSLVDFLGAEEGAVGADPPRALKVFGVEFSEATPGGVAGVVEQIVDGAELIADAGEGAGHGLGIGDVGGDGQGRMAFLGEFVGQLLHKVGRAGEHAHLAVFAGEFAHQGGTQASAYAGDNSDFRHGFFILC